MKNEKEQLEEDLDYERGLNRHLEKKIRDDKELNMILIGGGVGVFVYAAYDQTLLAGAIGFLIFVAACIWGAYRKQHPPK